MTGCNSQQLLRCLVFTSSSNFINLYVQCCCSALLRLEVLNYMYWNDSDLADQQKKKEKHKKASILQTRIWSWIHFQCFLDFRSYLHYYMWQCVQWLQSIQDQHLNVSSECSLYTSTVRSSKSAGSHMCPCHELPGHATASQLDLSLDYDKATPKSSFFEFCCIIALSSMSSADGQKFSLRTLCQRAEFRTLHTMGGIQQHNSLPFNFI